MTQKQSKIHTLGPKRMSSTGKGFFTNTLNTNSQTINTHSQGNFYSKPLLPVTTVPQPQIRYLLVQHPQFDTLVKQLTILRSKYDQLLVKFQQKSTQQTLRANIQDVIESTQNIQAKMSRIVEDANNYASHEEQKQNNPCSSLGKGSQSYQSGNFPSLQEQRIRHEKQCLQIIQTVNKATQKIEQLQIKNNKLVKQIQGQREWKQGLQKQNKRLRLMLQNMQRQKQQQIQRLSKQLKELKQETNNNTTKKQTLLTNQQINHPKNEVYHKQVNNEQVQQRQIVQVTRQRITNSQYLNDNQHCHLIDQVSGFSRLTINGQLSRLSKIYQ